MQIRTLTRREFLAASSLAFYSSGKRQYSLANGALGLHVAVGEGRVVGRSFENRLTGESLSLPPGEFVLEFDRGETVSSDRLQAAIGAASERALELIFLDGSGLEVRVHHSLSPGAHYLRKQISVRQTGGAARRLIRADLENWQAVRRNWDSMHADRFPYGSHPIFCESLWAGVEFVAAFNEFGPDGFTLRSRPGGLVVGPQWVDLRSTVIGVAESGAVREAFLRYLEDVRLAPPRMVACYNSWWTLPKVVTQQDSLALVEELKAAMHQRHGAFFDIIATDMGWSNPQSIWEIDRSILPHGFDDVRRIVESAGGKLGVWMSPSEVYPPVCDYDWAERNGYFVLRPDRDNPPRSQPAARNPGLSLADPKYRTKAKQQLKKLIRENGLDHIKYDGFWAKEHRPHHGLLPDDDSVEPLAAYSLELLQASKEASPDLVTEPTYLNSIVNYISPWILKYSDTVWGNAKDCVVGVGPAPEYRDSHTNAREFVIFKALDQVWVPQNAVHYFDIIHVDDSEGFANHAAMAVGRGRFFLSTYVNPKLMSDEDWRIFAGLLRWARQNSDLLRNTVVVRSRVERGEPYSYAHWLGPRGVLAIRNPSNESKQWTIDLKEAGAPSELADALCYTQYPYRKGIAAGLDGRSQLVVKLAPWELLFLEIVPRGQLKEAIALGARWYRRPDGQMAIVPDGDAEEVRLYEPGGGERVVPIAPRTREDLAGRLSAQTVTPLPESDWLAAKARTRSLFPFRYPASPDPDTIEKLKETEWREVKWRKVPTVGFEVECSVSVPREASSGEVLLLVEFPGREHRPSRASGWVDGRPVDLEPRSSDEHIGYFDNSEELRAVESEWCWYLCRLEGGPHQVKFSGAAGHPSPRLGLWAWAEYDVAEEQIPVSLGCNDPAMPQYRDRFERHGICLQRTV